MTGGALVVGLMEEGGAEVVVFWNVYEAVVSYEVIVEGEMVQLSLLFGGTGKIWLANEVDEGVNGGVVG